jgi:hypothetical protein
MKQILEDREDIVFYIKLLPLPIHPAAYKKSKVIACEKSIRLLERAFDGKTIPSEPRCDSTEVDDTIELTERLGITGTPAVVLPDGAVVRGFNEADQLVSLIVEAGLAVYEEKALAAQEAGGESEEKEEDADDEMESGSMESGESGEPDEDKRSDEKAESVKEDAPEEIDIKIKKIK